MLKQEDIPRRYSLAFVREPPALRVGIYDAGGYRYEDFLLRQTHHAQLEVAERLSTLLRVLERSSGGDPGRRQLISVITALNVGVIQAAPIGGHIHQSLRYWIAANHQTAKGRGDLEVIKEMMFVAFNAMSDFPAPVAEGPNPYGSIEALTTGNGDISFDGKGGSILSREGKIDWHNVSGPMRQLALLVALATLHELADKDMYPPPAST